MLVMIEITQLANRKVATDEKWGQKGQEKKNQYLSTVQYYWGNKNGGSSLKYMYFHIPNTWIFGFGNKKWELSKS